MDTVQQTAKTGRPATGSVRWNSKRGLWVARLTINGKRKDVAMSGIPHDDEPRAKARARILAKKALTDGTVTDETGETANEWFARYVDVHESLKKSVKQHMGDWNGWGAEFIGTKPIAASSSRVTPNDIKALRDNLTRARRDEEISAKRANNLWSVIVKAPLSRAFSDDDPNYASVRVGPASANPSLGIKPPCTRAEQEEDEKERQALDPAEALAFLSCEAIALDLRRLVAFGMYTGLRPAEMYGLTWADVRLAASKPVLKVQRGRDMKEGPDVKTKTRAGVRDVPIHPELRPLLRVWGKGKPAAERVFPVEDDRVRDVEKNVDALRASLLLAGIDREELQHSTDHVMAFDVRSLRTTFATWCSKAGYDSAWLDVWLGHKAKGTAAKHYVKDVPAFEEVTLKRVLRGVVPPFPPLPKSLLSEPKSLPKPQDEFRRFVSANRPKRINDSASLRCEGRDLNPYRSYPAGT